MFNKYNIYHAVLRAAAGDPPSGGTQDDADSSANAPTINMDDDLDKTPLKADDASPADKKDAKADDEEVVDPPADDAVRKPAVVPREAMLRRVGDLTKDKRTLTSEVERLKQENEALKAKKPDGDPPAADDPPKRGEYKTQAEFDAAVRQAAAAQREAEKFDERCNAVADAGEATFKADWNESVANLRMLGDDGNIPKLLLDAALEADDPAQALHHLGQNPEEAMRIMSLSPLKQVAEVVKHGLKKAAAPKKVVQKSNAPEPPDPLNGGGSADDQAGLGDEVDDETWMRNRQAEVDAAAVARRANGTGR